MANIPEDLEKIGDILDSEGGSGPCPMCAHEDWTMYSNSACSEITVTMSNIGERGFFSTYWVHCTNCGFVAHFLKSVIGGDAVPADEELGK